jgi:hypothetical protein
MFPSYIYDVLQNREIEVIVNTEKINPRLTATVVKSYVRQHKMRADQLSDLITSVHQALGQLGQPVTPEEVLTAAVSVRRSVHHDEAHPAVPGWSICSMRKPCAGDQRRAGGDIGWLGRDR